MQRPSIVRAICAFNAYKTPISTPCYFLDGLVVHIILDTIFFSHLFDWTKVRCTNVYTCICMGTHIELFCPGTICLIVMKLGMDEELIFSYTCKCFLGHFLNTFATLVFNWLTAVWIKLGLRKQVLLVLILLRVSQ